MAYFWVAFGGALGSVARFWMANIMLAATGPKFPWGTLLINVLGSFLISFIGLLVTPGRFALAYETRVFLMVGICGGFTTFSSFSLQTIDLIRAGQPGRAGLYVGLSVVLCLAACALGLAAASVINNSFLTSKSS